MVHRLEFDQIEVDLYQQTMTPEEAVEVIKNKEGVKENGGLMERLLRLFD